MIYAVTICVSLVEFSCIFIFLDKDITRDESCIISNVLTATGIYIIISNFFICGSLIIVSYSIIILKLKQRKKYMNNIMHNKNALNTDAKVTRATIITVGACIVTFLPSGMLTSISSFVEFPYMTIVQNACDLWYCLNNVINPFIYYMTLKDFKEGYKNLLLCKCCKSDSHQERSNQGVFQRRETERTVVSSVQLS